MDDDTPAVRAALRGPSARGVTLINDPEPYRHCHHLPESYPVIEPDVLTDHEVLLSWAGEAIRAAQGTGGG